MNNNQQSYALSYAINIVLILSLFIMMLHNSVAAVPTPFQGGSYHALIIGNNNYQDEQGAWKSLKNPINDAMSVADVLKRRYAHSEVNIRLLTDATRGEILGALNELSEQVNASDSVIVFYAGHGYLKEKTGEAFWIPVDAQGTDETNYLNHETIKRKLGIIADNANHVLLVSDSCFSGNLVRGIIFKPDDITPDYYSKKAKLKSIQVVAAGGEEFVDDNFRSTGHSPFTYFFLNELENNANQYLAVSEFVNNIEKNVANSVKQTPILGRLYGAGDESGEFIFTQIKLSKADIENEITQLLKSAENYFKQENFVSPPGNNARKRWEEVLRLDTSNRTAVQGLTRIAKYYVTMAKKHIENKRFDEAKKSLKIASDVKPGYPKIKSAQESLEKERDYISPPIITW